MARIRNKKTGEVKEVSDKELTKYGLGGNVDMAKNGIHINPKNKGKFNATKKKTGKTTEELTHSSNPVTKKRAIFAQNASHWKHEDGGQLPMYFTGGQFNPLMPDNQDPMITDGSGYSQPTAQQMGLTEITNPYTFNPGLTDSLMQYNKKNHLNYSPTLNPDEQTQYNDFQAKNKPNINFQQPNFTPITGNKYLQQSMKDFQRAGTFASNIGKQGNYNVPMFKSGGLMRYDFGGNNANDLHYNFGNQDNQFSNGYPTSYNPQQTPIDMQSMGQNSIQSVPTNTIDNTYYTPTSTQNNSQPSQTQGNSNPLGTIGGIAGTVANTGLGINHAIKGTLDIAGSYLQNKEEQKRNAQQFTQSVYSQAMDNRPQDYILNRNALAENGMQIKEIGGKGQPNVEVEGKEMISLPNGFSQTIQGDSHAEGGIPLSLPKGSKILSTKLKIETPKGKKSYSQIAKPFETKKNVDMLEAKGADDIQKATADMMIKFKKDKLEQLFQAQEQDKLMGKHGDKVQQGAMEDYGFTPQDEPEMVDYPEEENQEQDMSSYKKNGGLTIMATGGTKKYKLKNKEVEAKYTKAVPADYKPIEGYSDLFGKTTPGTQGKKYIPNENAWWKSLTPEQKAAHNIKRRAEIAKDPAYQGTPASEDYLYVDQQKPQVVTKPDIQFKDRYQYLKPNVNIDGMNLGIPLPSMYERGKLNFYNTNPNYVDPRYLQNQQDRNAVTETQRGFQNNLGSRGTGDVSNLLQGQVNAYKQFNELGQQKWNYDRNQDITAQTFNAQAKTRNDEFNQGNWFNQLENPSRQIDSAIGDQMLTDQYRRMERADQQFAYNNTKNFIDKRFGQYQNLNPQDIVGQIYGNNNSNYFNSSDNAYTTVTYDKNGNIISRKEAEKKAYGGKVKLSIKPKLKKK